MRAVVDTNVAVVANGNSAQASPTCVRTCATRLYGLMKSGKLVIDNQWLILREYMANLRSSGQPGTGDVFLKWVLTNYRNPDRCEQVPVTPKIGGFTDFEEFPSVPGLADFHGDDRKFVAVSMAHPARPPILQAVDAEWWELREQFCRAGVQVEFLCPNDMATPRQRGTRHRSGKK